MELAALAGVSPLEPLTPREMFWMAEARARESWDHTSVLQAMIHNAMAKRTKPPSAFHPFKTGGEKPKKSGGGMLGMAMAIRAQRGVGNG